MTQLTLEVVVARLEALERKVAEFAPTGGEPPGTSGDEQSDDPVSVARWLAAFDAIPPLAMTPDEEAAWQTARTGQKQIDEAARGRRADTFAGAGE